MHTSPLEGYYPDNEPIAALPPTPDPAAHGEGPTTTETHVEPPVAAPLSPVHDYNTGSFGSDGADSANGGRSSVLAEANSGLWFDDPAPVSPAPAAPANRSVPLWGEPVAAPAAEATTGTAANEYSGAPAPAPEPTPEPESVAFEVPLPLATESAARPPRGEDQDPVAGSRIIPEPVPPAETAPPRRPRAATPAPADTSASTTPAAPETPSHISRREKLAGIAKMAGEALVTTVAPASIAARWAVRRAGLAESAGQTLDRLPYWAKRTLRALDIGALTAVGTGLYRAYTGARGLRDSGADATASSLQDIRQGVNNFLQGAADNTPSTETSPDMTPAAHTTTVETPEGPDFGYDDMSRQALENDPGTGRASNVSDWSKQSYTYWLKELGATDEQIAQFFKDNPNAVEEANQKFFESNPNVNTNDAFGGGLNAGETYETGEQNDHAWTKAEEWAEANGIFDPSEPGDAPQPPADSGSDNSGQSGTGSLHDNDGSNPNPDSSPSSSPAPSSPSATPESPAPSTSAPAAPAEPSDKPSGAPQPSSSPSEPAPTAPASEGPVGPDGAQDTKGDKPQGNHENSKPSFTQTYIAPVVIGGVLPAAFTGAGYILGNEAAKRAQDAGVPSYSRRPDTDRTDDDDDETTS